MKCFFYVKRYYDNMRILKITSLTEGEFEVIFIFQNAIGEI